MSKEHKKNTLPSQRINLLYCTASLSVLVQPPQAIWSASWIVLDAKAFGLQL